MPFAQIDDLRCHYSLTGVANAPALVLSNSLGTSFGMWDPQLPEFEKHFTVLRYDTRGHGQSSVTPGPYSTQRLATDVLRLLDHLQIGQASFCGLSMGGFVGIWLGANAPERVKKIVLCNTAAKVGTAESWNSRIDLVRTKGMKAVAPLVIERWFTPEFRAASPGKVAPVQQMLENSPAAGYVAACEGIRDMDLSGLLSAIPVPTLVVSGKKDPTTPPAEGQFLRDHIPAALYTELDAAHSSNVEAAESFTANVLRFLLS